jgi:hypothetical protein
MLTFPVEARITVRTRGDRPVKTLMVDSFQTYQAAEAWINEHAPRLRQRYPNLVTEISFPADRAYELGYRGLPKS